MMFCPVMLCSIVGVELERVLTTGLEVTTVGAVRAVTEMVPGAVTVMAGRGMLAAACVFTGIVTTWGEKSNYNPAGIVNQFHYYKPAGHCAPT